MHKIRISFEKPCLLNASFVYFNKIHIENSVYFVFILHRIVHVRIVVRELLLFHLKFNIQKKRINNVKKKKFKAQDFHI